jgi:hypothetical protein
MLEYIHINQRLHLLCQVLAGTAATFVTEKEDYSHTNLAFDPISGRLSSRWMEATNVQVYLALNIYKSSFQWIDQFLNVIGEIQIKDNTIEQLEAAVTDSFHQVGLASNKPMVDLKYEIEDYPFSNEPFKELNKAGVEIWTECRSMANHACQDILNYTNASAEIRIWPHHFDTGIYFTIQDQLGIGFGLAIKDNLAHAPYFYLSGYGLKDEVEMRKLPALPAGRWITGKWKGAILPFDELEQSGLQKSDVVKSFFQVALAWYLKKSWK